MNLSYLANLISLGLFALIFMALIDLVSAVSNFNSFTFNSNMFVSACPLPIYNGVATLHTINGFNINYTTVSNNAIKTDFNGTKFECFIDTTQHPPTYGANTVIYQYGATTFWGTIPYGWLGWASDTLGVAFQRMEAGATIGFVFITPIGFNILGYTLFDVNAFAQLIIISVYAVCYILVGAMIYKLVSPYAGT